MKLKNNLIAILVIVLIFVNFVASTVMSIKAVYSTVEASEKQMTESFAQNVYNAVTNELEQPVTVGKAVVSTETLINLLKNEEDYTIEELEEIFKSYLMNYSVYFNYNTISIVSDKTGNYYTQHGFNKTIDPENDEHDVWYRAFLETGKEYDFEIDTDEVNGNKWTLFMNIRILDNDGNLLGVSGLGVDLSYLQDVIADLEKQYDIKVSFVDRAGNVQLGSGNASVTERVISSSDIKNRYFYTTSKMFDDKYTVSMQIEDLGWIMLVEKENRLKEYTIGIVKNNLIVMAILVFIVIVIVAFSINRNQSDLMKASEDAHKASEAKGQFLANMSHEIRTPINGILGMDEMLLKVCTDEKQIEYAKNIQSAGKTLLSLINDILDISKIESGKMEIIDVDYDLFSVFNDCYNINVFRVRNKGLDFIMDIDPKLPSILHGDEVRVRQVINNILSNAAKYTSEGKVVLIANYEELDESNIILKIKVSDTGMGIKEEDIDKLFTSFTRVDEEKNRNIEGTGLGLNLCHNLVRLMKGDINVESVYGEGSTFTVSIPQRIVNREPMGDFGEKYQEYAKNIETKNTVFSAPDASILIVDDVEMNLMVATGLLDNTGIKIDTAKSGEECIDKMLVNDYDIVLLDHMMPGMDGIETLQKWSTMDKEHNNDTPVIMLTANALQGAKEQYISVGFTDYLSKPIVESELKEMLGKYLPESKKMISEKADLDVSIIDMVKWKRELENRYLQRQMDTKVHIRVIIDANIPAYIEGDKRILDEVLDRLVEEAFAHTKVGKIVIKIAKSDNSEDELLTIEYSVRDSGNSYDINSSNVLKAKEELVKLNCSLYISNVTDLGASASFLYKQMAKSHNRIADVIEEYDNISEDCQQNDNKALELDKTESLQGNKKEAEISIEGIDVAKGLEYVQGKETLYLEILKAFIKSSAEFEASLKKAFTDKDYKNYRIGAHSIKSQSYSIGATELGDLAKLLEFAARDEDGEQIINNHDNFINEINSIREKVKNYLKDKGIETEEKLDSDIDRLLAAIDDFDMEKSLELLDKIDGDEEIIKDIRQTLEEFNYFDAHDLVEKLR